MNMCKYYCIVHEAPLVIWYFSRLKGNSIAENSLCKKIFLQEVDKCRRRGKIHLTLGKEKELN